MFNNPDDVTKPERPAPEFQDNYQAQPWFVSDSKTKSSVNQKSKKVVKRLTSVLFPLIGLAAIIAILAFVLYFVTRMYQ